MKKLEAIGRQLRSHRINRYRSPTRRTLDGHQRPRHRHGGLQRTGLSRHRAPLIVAHEVTNQGHDRSQLTAMAQQTRKCSKRATSRCSPTRVLQCEEIMKCEQAGVMPLVPKPLTNNSATTGRFDKRDFHYDAKRDLYRCPAGEYAIWRFTSVQNGMAIRKYWSSACPKCPIRSDCTTGDYRRIMRWEHEAVIERMQRRLDRMPQAGRLRRQTVEHTFGTLKSWMGGTHFLTKRLRACERR